MDLNILVNEEAKEENQNLKVEYLQDAKFSLEIQCKELKLNNEILRKIIRELTEQKKDEKGESATQALSLIQLIQKNCTLQDRMVGLFEEISKKQAEIFLISQVNKHIEQENAQFMANYEDKILQLRRLLQAKENRIQQYEIEFPDKFSDKQLILIPPYNVSLHFYTEMEEYKNLNRQLRQENLTLKKENSQILAELEDYRIKNLKIEKILKTRWSYLDYKSIVEQKRPNSMEKYGDDLKQKSLSNLYSKNLMQNSTAFSSINFKNDCSYSIRNILVKYSADRQKLKESIRNLTKKNKSLKKLNEALLESNNFYKNTRKKMVEEKEQQKMLACNLINILLRRSSNAYQNLNRYCNEDNQGIFDRKQKVIQQIAQHQEQKIPKELLLKLKEQLSKLPQPPIIKIKRIKNKVQKSYSCMIDYWRETNSMIINKKPSQDESLIFPQQDDDYSIIVAGTKKQKFQMSNKQKQEQFSSIFDGL